MTSGLRSALTLGNRYDVLDDAGDQGDDEKPSQTVDEDFEML